MSKLIPPDPSMHYMRRSKLLKKLSQCTQAKLTIVQSGAGFGKTSALAQMMADQKHLYSWYQITEEDDDVLPFLRHLFYSIQRVYPEFGQSGTAWDHFSLFPNLEELNRLYIWFVNELCKIKTPFIVVIDDFHLVRHVFPINYILDKIIEHLPSNIHFIVSSRVYPNWNCIFPLQMKGQVIECKEEDFIFSKEEIQVLFEDYFGRFLKVEEIETILSVTEGWAIAILLIAMRSNDSALPIDEITNYSLQDFFSFLSGEVFDNLNEIQQDVLLKISIFKTFSIELIENFYNKEVAAQLNELLQQQAFIQPLVGHKEFRLHSLFQQFLEAKMREYSEEEYRELHNNATKFYIQKNNSINALYHAFKTDNKQLIAEVLLQFAPSFIEAGRFDFFLERFKELKEEGNETAYYALHFYAGECQRYRAQYEKAKNAYENCLFLAILNEDSLYIIRANAGLARIYLDTIQPALAEKYLKAALSLVDQVEMDKEEVYLLQRLYAENLVNLGRAGEAENWVKSKGIPSRVLLIGNLDVRIKLRQGKLLEANELIKQREGRDSFSDEAHRESDILHALILSLIGENEEAFIRAITSINNSIRDHSKYAEAVAYLRKGHATMLVNPFELQEAERCYLKTIQIMDEIRVKRAKAESYMGLAIVKSRQGYMNEAISFAKIGLFETERVQDRWVSALLLTAITIIYVENGYYQEANEYAMKAMKLFQKSQDKYGEMVIYFWLSYIAHAQKNDEELKKSFQEFLNICDKQNYYFFLHNQTFLGPRNLLIFHQLLQRTIQLLPNDSLLMEVAQLFQLKVEDTIPKHFFRLKLLGPFMLYRDRLEIDEKAWKREKAKELFLYLYLHRNRYISKEEIMNTLWPSADEQTMARDFKVAYNACLKVLDPERTPREESAYIIRKQSMYKLQESVAFISDIDYFQKFSKLGLTEKLPTLAIEWLLKAESIYQGNLLEDCYTFDWLQQKREELFKLYITVVERIAQTYIKLQNFREVIHWAEKLIQLDSTWEEGYRLLMLSYYHLDNRPLALKWYEKCVEILEKELNIEPMESTIQIFEMITR